MSKVISVAHDFICPWCWIGLSQVQRLSLEFDVEFDWVGYELWPIELDWPEPGQKSEEISKKPPTPTKFDLALAAEGLPATNVDRPRRMRSNNSHQAVEFAKTLGVGDLMISKLYRAYWIRGENINDVDVICALSKEFIPDLNPMRNAIKSVAFRDKIVYFDDDAYAIGVYNVPTFWVGEELLAEQPYSVLRAKIEKHLS